jgi:hypothetical protein
MLSDPDRERRPGIAKGPAVDLPMAEPLDRPRSARRGNDEIADGEFFDCDFAAIGEDPGVGSKACDIRNRRARDIERRRRTGGEAEVMEDIGAAARRNGKG